MTTIELNKVDDPYIVNAFSISPEHGFGLIPKPIEVGRCLCISKLILS